VTIIRAPRAERYTILRRDLINDGRLSFRALGVLAYILDKPDDWKIDAEDMSHTHGEGRDAIRTALSELEAAGYLVRQKYRKEDGTWAADSTVYDVPVDQSGKPAAADPPRETSAGNPVAITSTGPSTGTEEATDATRRPDAKACGARAENDALFQSMVSACGMDYGEMTARQRKSCGVAMAELRRVGATPEEVERRAMIYRQTFTATLTPNALTNQWAMLRELPVATAAPPPKQSVAMSSVRRALEGLRGTDVPSDNVVPLPRTGT